MINLIMIFNNSNQDKQIFKDIQPKEKDIKEVEKEEDKYQADALNQESKAREKHQEK